MTETAIQGGSRRRYPGHLQGSSGIADSFEAMTSKRCYKELMPVEKALRIIREEEGKQFDPDMAEVFIHIFREGKIHLAEPAELKREEKA